MTRRRQRTLVHSSSARPGRVVCEQCGKFYSSKTKLRVHQMKRHSRELQLLLYIWCLPQWIFILPPFLQIQAGLLTIIGLSLTIELLKVTRHGGFICLFTGGWSEIIVNRLYKCYVRGGYLCALLNGGIYLDVISHARASPRLIIFVRRDGWLRQKAKKKSMYYVITSQCTFFHDATWHWRSLPSPRVI